MSRRSVTLDRSLLGAVWPGEPDRDRLAQPVLGMNVGLDC